VALRVGSLVFCTDQGLGHLAKSFYDAGVVTDPLLVRHGRRPEHPEWFPGATYAGTHRAVTPEMGDLVGRVDVMLFFETPFCWDLIPYCRGRGVATVLMPMHECMPDPLPETPDAFLCPSLLEAECYPPGAGVLSEFVPVPTDFPRFPQWRRRDKAEVFVHNAGWGGLKGRNGTRTALEAWRYVRSDARLILRCQDSMWNNSGGYKLAAPADPRVQVFYGTLPRERLYSEGDVFLFPERFNGLSLPLQEAYAAGMLVMATDRHPVNSWLPHGPLVPAEGFVESRVSPRCRAFREAVVRPSAVARMVDEWYGREIGPSSEGGRAWAEEHSWAKLGGRYLGFLERVVAGVRGRAVA
jgi:hypothetical protein